MKKTVVLSIILILFSQFLFSQVYIWTDENGVKHCSSTPPPEGDNAKQYKEVEKYTHQQCFTHRQIQGGEHADGNRQRFLGAGQNHRNCPFPFKLQNPAGAPAQAE